MMNKDKMIEWISTHRVGVSSRTMWTALMGVTPKDTDNCISYDVPYDADDFSRCYDLVKFCNIDPKTDFPKIIAVFPWYKPILIRWDMLTMLYERKSWQGFQNAIDVAVNEYRKLRNIN